MRANTHITIADCVSFQSACCLSKTRLPVLPSSLISIWHAWTRQLCLDNLDCWLPFSMCFVGAKHGQLIWLSTEGLFCKEPIKFHDPIISDISTKESTGMDTKAATSLHSKHHGKSVDHKVSAAASDGNAAVRNTIFNKGVLYFSFWKAQAHFASVKKSDAESIKWNMKIPRYITCWSKLNKNVWQLRHSPSPRRASIAYSTEEILCLFAASHVHLQDITVLMVLQSSIAKNKISRMHRAFLLLPLTHL